MKTKTFFIILSLMVFSACKNDPKVIQSTTEDNKTTASSGIFSGESPNEPNTNQNAAFSNDLHTVVVNEVLPTKKYVYLNVNEGNEKFWIATRTVDVKVGETYYYKGGLLKTNFESKEYNRIFDKVYLISSLVSADHANHSSVEDIKDYSEKSQYTPNPAKVDIPTHTDKILEFKGSIKISDLVKSPKKYEGKTVQISGVCTKINPGIMDRNWIHVKDGSKDDYDLVITSSTFIPEGKAFTMKAIVTLNKDFGAGYKYDLILEDGISVE
jgi:hypothetical protein